MEAKQCPKGHYYDSDKFSSCPFCGGDGASETAPIGGTMALEGEAYDAVPPTEPFTEGAAAPSPELGKTEPLDAASVYPAAGDEIGATVPHDEANLGFIPTVGWVICIRGPHKGNDYRLVTGYNKIGRSPEMAISLPNDEQVTRDSHAIIAYEPQARKFFVAGDKNMIYLNGNFSVGMQELHIHDVIKIGASELMFIPLCGESFNWE